MRNHNPYTPSAEAKRDARAAVEKLSDMPLDDSNVSEWINQTQKLLQALVRLDKVVKQEARR